MRFKRFIAENTQWIIALLVFAMLLCFAGCHIYVRQQMLNDYYAMVGNAYVKDKELAEKLTACIYEDEVTKDTINAGKTAMEKSGYTYDGIIYLKTYDICAYFVCYAAVALIFALIIIMLLRYRKNVRLLVAHERNQIEAELLHSNMGERQYLQKKNAQTQSYIENVAHQVRTPLTNILININMIYDNQTEEDRAVLDECGYHAERINKLMDRLLKIGRLEAGKVIMERQEENLGKLLKGISESYCNVYAHLENVVLCIDYDWIYEAFSCLIENCIEHNEPGSRVEVRLYTEDKKAVAVIEDSGSGFNEDDLPYMFERFYSDSRYKATGHYGIGLNLAKMIIEAHYGTIKAYNRESGGAGFRVELPVIKLKNKKIDNNLENVIVV